MRPYLRYVFTCGALLWLLVMGYLVSRPAGAQPVPAVRPAAPQVSATPSATPSCQPGWTIYPNPAPPGDSVLDGLTALAPNDLWAVGAYTSTGIITATTLTVHGNGTSWTTVPSPNPPTSKAVLHAVAGVAANDVWAVGEYNGGQYGEWQTLTMHWDGTAWTIVPSPSSAYSSNHLYAVTAIASNDVWAVGRIGDGDFPHEYALAEHWDGTQWRLVPTPNVTGTGLYGVAVAGANDVWAVGGGYTTYPAYGTAVIEHWNGSAWSIVSSPSAPSYALRAVTVVAANDIWAVGHQPSGSRTLIEHWDGTAWSIVPSPTPGATTNTLYGVSARAANDVWAVGDTNQASGGVKTFALHWDGTGWYQVPTPADPAGRGTFYAVAANGATGGPVWAVGETGCLSGCTQNALIARASPSCLTPVPTNTPTATNTPTPACGLDWRGVSGPNPPGGARINGVAAVSANDIWAVGWYYPNNYIQALAEHWDGTQWSIVPYDPNPGGTSVLFAVAVVASNDVWAVGDNPDNYTTLIEHWDGTSWSRVPSPNPGDYHTLLGVAAVASSDVWAVGYQQTNGVDTPLIEHWNGSVWSVVSSPNVGSQSFLYAVATVAGNANDIWAVGYSSGPQTLVEHWNGSSWSVVPSPGAGSLQSVAAVAANDVWAVGCSLYCNQIGSQTLVEHWNGSTWSIVPSPNPFAGNNQLFGVAAAAPNDVWAVGFSSPDSSPYQTLIEHWNGSQWSVVPGPGPLGSALYAVAAVAANNVWAGGSLIEHYNDPCAGTGTPTRTPTRVPSTTPTRTPAATATCTPGAAWSIRPERSQGDLRGVAAVSANDIWAVGTGNQAEHWDGATWSAVPVPTPGSSSITLLGVAAIAANDVWAVGQTGTQPLIEHWDGAAWSIVPGANTGPGALYAVAALGANDVWAVGTAGLIEHWNGSAWSLVSGANGPLYALAAVAANDVWAVGGSPGQTLTVHWNGSTWSAVPSPSNGTLYGVTAISANDLWAVGQVTMHWDGASWSVVPSPPSGARLYAVAAVSANDVWAVGYSPSPEVFHVTSLHWDGAAWSIVPITDHGQGAWSSLYGVVAVATNDVWAVGYDTNGTGSYKLIEHYPAPPCGAQTATPTVAASTTPTRPPSNTPTGTSTRPPTVPPTQTPGAPPPNTPTSTSTRLPTAAPTQTPGGPSATPRPPTTTPGAPTATGTPCAIPFSDVLPTDYFYTPVQYLYCHGVISGYSDNTFRPYNNTTRAQMVKIVVLGFALPITTPSGGGYTFTDVQPGFPFFDVIETAAAHNIVSGYTCGGPGEPCDPQNRPYFRPYANVTRGQLAKIAVTAAGWPLLNPSTGSFADVFPNTAFYTFIETAYCHGIISGYTCGGPGEPCDPQQRPYFRQANAATRGQIAKIVYLAATAGGSCPGASAP